MSSDRLAELVARLNQAREEFRAAMENDRRVDRLVEDLGMPHPDGTRALRNATQARSAATARYIEALREFTDFVMSRTADSAGE